MKHNTWEKEFDEKYTNRLSFLPSFAKDGVLLLLNDIKQFIKSLLKEQRHVDKQEMIERIEKQQGKDNVGTLNKNLFGLGYDKAFEDVLSILKGLR